MSRTSSGVRGRRRILSLVAAAGVLASGLAAVGTTAAAKPPASAPTVKAVKPAPFKSGTYTVLLRGEPAVTYTGGVAGYPRTAPTDDRQFRPTADAVESYVDRLERVQEAVADRVGADPFYHYTYVLNGFAARLSGAQATALSKQPNVLAVVRDRLWQIDTVNSPDMLGLTGRLGTWRRVGGTDPIRGAGSGAIVGIVDTGINSDHESFARIPGGRVPRDWYGVCETGDGADVGTFSCNNKLIGGRYFVDGFGRDGIAEYELLSPEDTNGHGSHTAGTAAGHYGPHAVIEGHDYGVASGMAPAAKLAAYKVCWDGVEPGTGGCAGTDSQAAIDAAVADGVDVINFSISGTQDDFLDPVEIAFLNAAESGVFVAASAGNSGPYPSTVNHPSPWITTVAASTHAINEATLILGNGQTFLGASLIEEPLPLTDTVLAVDSAAEGVTEEDAQLCYPGTLDASEVAGKVVVCDRGVIARVDKSRAVEEAGGVGMVLVNTSPSSLNADSHFVPTIHVSDVHRDAIYEYVENAPDPESAFDPSSVGSDTQIPEVIDFSSRGPTFGASGDLLKPDISAPGVDVVAPVAPESNYGRSWDFYSGTSMSSPHIAGLAALIMDARGRWSPMEIKSAMMTTARGHASPTSVFAEGAGFVKPREFLDPGLVYDSEYEDWVDFLAGQGVVFGNGEPVSDSPLKASNLNLASIAIGDLAGREVVRRTVRNVDDEVAVYRARVDGLEGVDVRVVPRRIKLRAGATEHYKVIFTREDASFDEYVSGQLVWTDGQHEVRSPIAVRPVALAAEDEVVVDGNADFQTSVKAGFAGVLVARVKGLVPGIETEGSAVNTSGDFWDPSDPRNYRQEIFVGRRVIFTRIQIEPDDYNDDLDLFLTRDTPEGLELIAYSATGAADERIDLTDLEPGEYTIHVQAWAVNGGEDRTTFEVETFKVRRADRGNLDVEPDRTRVEVGERVTITGDISGLDPDEPYLGLIRYLQRGEGRVGQTIVSVQE